MRIIARHFSLACINLLSDFFVMYDTSKLRRQDRAMDESAARHLLAAGQHAVLAMQNVGAGGYAVPIDYVWDGESCIYIHCAPDGHKLRCIQACSLVSLVVTGSVRTLPHMFSTAYESLVVQGEAALVECESEKRHALWLLLQKYTPHEMERGVGYIDRALSHTTVLRIRIHSWCGKAHRSE